MLIFDNRVTAPWVMQRAGCSISSDCQTIGQVLDDKIVAGVMFENYTGPAITGTIAVEKDYAMSREFVRAIFDYPFKQLECRTILASASSGNTRSKNLLEHMGFVRTATIPGVYEDGDMDIYVLKREDCRFLGEDDGQG